MGELSHPVSLGELNGLIGVKEGRNHGNVNDKESDLTRRGSSIVVKE